MHRIRKLACGVFIAGRLFILTPIEAAVIYVDKDSPCPGVGTSGNPYCSIQNAFNAVAAGDTIRIRKAATPYDEYAAVTDSAQSGTARNPIIVEPDIGHDPIIRYTGNSAMRGAIHLRHVSYWRVQNLTFDGTGIQTSDYAVMIEANTQDVTGIEIIGNTFKNWGGDFANSVGTAAVAFISVKDSLIRENTFKGNRSDAVFLSRTTDIIVENNDITDQKCGKTKAGTINQTGIRIIGGSQFPADRPNLRTIVRGNTVHDFSSIDDCEGPVDYIMGIWADVNTFNGAVYNNVIYNISQDNSAKGVGIIIEARCHDWNVHNNVLYKIGNNGIRNGNIFNDANNNTYVNNTLFKAGSIGFNVVNGKNIVFKNNFVVGSSALSVNVKAPAVSDRGLKIDFNLYDGTRIGRWNDRGEGVDFPTWKQVCSCDVHSLNTDPRFVNPEAGDFRLQADSPARRAGENKVDLGARP